jgi:hypothetical protein
MEYLSLDTDLSIAYIIAERYKKDVATTGILPTKYDIIFISISAAERSVFPESETIEKEIIKSHPFSLITW